jgi:hypothetical protein
MPVDRSRLDSFGPNPMLGLVLQRACLVGFSLLIAASAPADPSALEAHVRHLSSAELGGRLTGTEGERLAADYLVGQLEALGAEPLAGQQMRIPFEFAAGTTDAGTRLEIEHSESALRWEDPAQVRALSFSSSEKVTGPVVFAGYGLVVPEVLGDTYDSYADLDVEGKIAVVLRYFPEDLEHDERAALSRYSGLRYKALAARERGAKALLVVTGPRSPNAGETVPMTFDTAVSGSGIVAASLAGEAAQALFADLPQGSLEEIQRSFDSGSPHVQGFELRDRRVSIDARVERERRRGWNVVAMLAGTDPDEQAVLVGAHYDHLGPGEHGSSLSRREERGRIHPGADDNASGTAAVLDIGAQLARKRPRRDVVLAFWSGEELGVLGSSDFVKRAHAPAEKLLAILNFDMVGRARENRLLVQGVGTSPIWRGVLERANTPAGFDLRLRDDPHIPTDSSVFDAARIPSLNFFTGSHADYHRPTDTAGRLDYEALTRVAALGARLTRALANGEATVDFVEVEGRHVDGAGVGGLRVYTGTVPDYGSEAHGLTLADVAEGGPAARAGLRGGDVIVRFGSQEITNIYDYTYALDAARVGEALGVVYLRNGERLQTTIVPEARR